MGKILTLDEFRKRELPDIEMKSFDRVLRSFRRRIHNAPSIIGGLLYGSALYRSFTMLSDVDCVVLYDFEQRSHALKVVRGWVEFAHKKHIKASPIFIDQVVAGNGLHSFTPHFWDHLQNCSVVWNGSVKENPLDYFSKPTIDGIQSIKETELNYFRFKLASLDKSFVKWKILDESSRFRFAQKALEAPMHTARKVLELKGAFSNSQSPSRDTKSKTLNTYVANMPKELGQMLDRIDTAQHIYITELHSQMSQPARDPDQKYQGTVDRYFRMIPLCIEFVRLNALYVQNEL